jgi:Protein of unknown function (DUF2905)
MDSLRELGRWLVVLGVLLLAAGGFLLAGWRLPLRLGHLPGDIVYHGRHSTFYFPVVTCIVVSVALTLLFWIVNAFRR